VQGSAVSLCAGGRGISSAGDELHFVYREVDGDFEVAARLADLSGGNLLAGAGLMLRESVEDEAAFVALLAERRFADDPDDPPTALYLRARYRVATDANTSARNLGAIDDYGTAPLWLRLRRTGGTVSAFISRSPEGSFAETPDYEMTSTGDPVVVGLAAYGRDGQDATKPFRALAATFEAVELPEPPVAVPQFVRADANSDGKVDLSDAVAILGYLFLGGSLECLDAADSNDDGKIDLSDPIYILNFLFVGGPAPPPPYPDCGEDPTDDAVDCGAYEPCH
jgi:hypothetical protein